MPMNKYDHCGATPGDGTNQREICATGREMKKG